MEVTLVDHHNFHTFQPLLYQVATAGLDPADVAYPGAHHLRPRPQRRRSATAAPRRSTSRPAAWPSPTAPPLDYDHLVVATGATTGFFAVPGAAQHALPLYTLADARRLRNAVLGSPRGRRRPSRGLRRRRADLRRGGWGCHRRGDVRAR